MWILGSETRLEYRVDRAATYGTPLLVAPCIAGAVGLLVCGNASGAKGVAARHRQAHGAEGLLVEAYAAVEGLRGRGRGRFSDLQTLLGHLVLVGLRLQLEHQLLGVVIRECVEAPREELVLVRRLDGVVLLHRGELLAQHTFFQMIAREHGTLLGAPHCTHRGVDCGARVALGSL